jgi:AspT/YidE/YbjL antiporter-like protein
MSDLDSRHVDELAALLAVARGGSFVEAGLSLQRHATIISKRIAALERRLGVRLLERTTRRVRLTEAGALLVERLRFAGNLILEAEQEASAGAAEIRGRLRLALPAAMGRLWLAPLLPAFLLRYPSLQVEAYYSERYVDLVAEGFDAAIRIGILSDSRLIAKRLGIVRRVLCTSPDYVRRNGAPATPQELASHNCLSLTGLPSFPEWRLWNGKRKEAVVARGSLVSDDGGALLGVLFGLVPIPVPGVGTVTLGIGGGPLIVALILGRFRRTGPISWVMPLPANIVLRNFGLTLFLAAVGINSGQAFVTTVAATGPLMLLIGAAVLLTTVGIVLLAGFHLLRLPYDDLLGVAAGATGNPAILVYATRMAPTERPDIGYAMIFPSATIVKVVAVQIIGLVALGG